MNYHLSPHFCEVIAVLLMISQEYTHDEIKQLLQSVSRTLTSSGATMYFVTQIICLLFCYLRAGETDWKVIAIDVEDPLAKDLNGKHS